MKYSGGYVPTEVIINTSVTYRPKDHEMSAALIVAFVVAIAQRLRYINKSLSTFFYLFGACMIGIAATSYSLNGTVYAVHWAFAIALTAFLPL